MSQQIEGVGSRAVKQRAMHMLEKHGLLEERRWTILFTLAAVILMLLIIGSYVFNWTWTGFRGNTLWDWFQMLLEPLIIAL
ncbi:MAG: hypothetical protein JOZ18_06805, partial [Chloroflexi bacterium]|nr:hypothetical protein [Chloroflexota bacterium]